jgi:hypothetical protein
MMKNLVKESIGCEFGTQSFPRLNSLDYDVPLPLKSFIDRVAIDHGDELCTIDYKTTSQLCKDENEAKVKYMHQSILPALSLEGMIAQNDIYPDDAITEMLKKYPKSKNGVRFAYFYEIKSSKNRDGTPQTRLWKIDLNKMRPLYEAMIYDQITGFMNAIQDPEHIYQMNLNDNFCDKGEMLDFWIKKYLEKEEINLQEQEAAKKQESKIAIIGKELLSSIKDDSQYLTLKDMADKSPAERIEFKLKILGFPAKIEKTVDSFSCITYLLKPIAATSASAIAKKHMDIAHALGEEFVRISPNLVQIENESFISVEVNKKKEDRKFPGKAEKMDGIALGMDTMNNNVSWMIEDHSTPHLMIAGATGSGKSVAINSIIRQATEQGYNIEILDPKYEFTDHKNSIQDADDIVLVLNDLVCEMDKLYRTKQKVKKVIIFDEASDILTRTKMDKSDKTLKTPKDCVLLLAQKGRACGIHLVMASQRITAKLFDGDTKANFAARLCLTTASSIDSKVMIEQEGAEFLGGHGDALYDDPNYKQPVRIQCYS